MKINFADETHYFQRFVRENISLLGNYKIVGEQIHLSNNEKSYIDMLVIDLNDNKLVVVELKNRLTTDKDSWQPIRYYDLLKRGEDDLKILLINAGFSDKSISLEPKVLFVVPECNEQLLRTLSYFENIDSKVIEVKIIQNENSTEFTKKVFYPSSIYHQEDLVTIKEDKTKVWTMEDYELKSNKKKIELAKRIISQVKSSFSNNGHQFDIFFSKTKITLNKDNKVWGHIFIQQSPLSHNLTFSFKTDKIVNKNDFLYEPSVEKMEVQKETLKLLINNTLPQSIIGKYFC